MADSSRERKRGRRTLGAERNRIPSKPDSPLLLGGRGRLADYQFFRRSAFVAAPRKSAALFRPSASGALTRRRYGESQGAGVIFPRRVDSEQTLASAG